MRISLIAGLNNESPVDTCIRDPTRARDEGFARIWMTQMPYDTGRCGASASISTVCCHSWRRRLRTRRASS